MTRAHQMGMLLSRVWISARGANRVIYSQCWGSIVRGHATPPIFGGVARPSVEHSLADYKGNPCQRPGGSSARRNGARLKRFRVTQKRGPRLTEYRGRSCRAASPTRSSRPVSRDLSLDPGVVGGLLTGPVLC